MKKSRIPLPPAAFALVMTAPALFAVNLAPAGTGLMGSNDATITDAGTSHFQAGVLANIRDGSLTTRVDNYSTTQTGVNGFVGIRWATARTEALRSLTLTMAAFGDGGWFGNRECPKPGSPLTAPMLAPPVVQVSRVSTLATWETVPATTDYVSAFTGHAIPGNEMPTSRSFTFALPLKQTGLYGVRILGPAGGWGDGTGFIGVFELAVEADVLADTDADGMDDAWETAHGLNVGVNDAALDAGDSDGLPNGREFLWGTHPQLPDSDGDGLNDDGEDLTHSTFPNAADSDGDSLSDGVEILTHLTNARLPDTDGDGLADAAEISVHLTQPLTRDTDGDGFSDGMEIALGSLPLSAASRPANIARAGTALMGTNTTPANISTTGRPRLNANASASLIDGDGNTRADTSGAANDNASHLGVIWDAPWPQPVARLEVAFATLADGGWFGQFQSTPGGGNPLNAPRVIEPGVQTTTDGVNWITVPATSTYTSRLVSHVIGGGNQPAATRRAAVFTLTTPASGLRGVRLAGQHGGNNNRGYVAAFELAVTDTSMPADTDGDGLTDAEETTRGTSVIYSDTDEDALDDRVEAKVRLTNPLTADTDADAFPDGLEVAGLTDPTAAASTPGNLALLGGGLIGTNNAIDTDAGTAVVHAGTTNDLTDGNPWTRVDSFNGSGSDAFSFLGVRWATSRTVARLEVVFATFVNGGWFGPTNAGPAGAGLLTGAHLLEPVVQVTTDDGLSWTTVPHASDYPTALAAHSIGGGVNPLATASPPATFTLTTPAPGVNGIRLIGREGGSAQGFAAAFEVGAFATTNPTDADTDNDGLPDVWELGNYPSLASANASTDSDHDGSNGLLEYAFNLNPHAFDQPPSAVMEDGYLTMTITKRPHVTYLIVSGATLDDFSAGNTVVSINNTVSLKARDAIQADAAPRRFLRVVVTAQP